MALTRRLLATALAGSFLAAAGTAPALAYWHATGRGTGTVPTAAAAANVITLQLVPAGTGHAVKASGQAGSTSAYLNSVSVVLCKSNTFPCTNGSAITLTATVTAGAYSVTSGNVNTLGTVYAQANQVQTSGWRDYSAVAGGFNP